MAKITTSRKARALRLGRIGAHRKVAAPEIDIVRLEEGGLGWRITTGKGTPVKFRFGRVHAPDDPKAQAKYEVSAKAIDRALRDVSTAKIGRAPVSLSRDKQVRLHEQRKAAALRRLKRVRRENEVRLGDHD